MNWIAENPIMFWGAIGLLGALATFIYKVGEWKGNVDNCIKQFNTFMEEVRLDIKTLVGLSGGKAPVIGTQSPMHLTETGQQIAKDIKAEQIVKPYVEALSKTFARMNSYEIQERCMKFARHDLMVDLKSKEPTKAETLELYSFNEGRSLSELFDILGIVLRDKILERLSAKI